MYQIHYTSRSKVLNTEYHGVWRAPNIKAALEHLKWNATKHSLNRVSSTHDRDGSFLYQAESKDLMFTALGMPLENDSKVHYVEEYINS